MLKALTQPKVLIPILLSAALLAFVFSIADSTKAIDQIRQMPIPVMVITFFLALSYLLVKGVQWHLFVNGLGILISWRQLLVAYAVGEMSLTVPAGVYAQNYVLRGIAGADFSRSSASTTAVLATEASVSLLALLLLGVPGWDWLRPAIVSFFILSFLVVVALLKIRPVSNFVSALLRAGPLKRVGPEFLELVDGLGMLFAPRVAARAAPLAFVYLFALVSGFFLVTRSVGLTHFTLEQAVTVYLFALTVVLLMPISSHLGVTEASGLGAMHAWGYSSTEALAALLGFRLVWTGAIWIICAPALVLLRGEFSRSQ